jgi:NitT/TauT family transport system permease protein
MPSQRRVRYLRQIRENLIVLVTLVVVVILWQVLTQSGVIPQYLLPSPTSIISTYFSSGVDWFSQTLVTLREILIGFALGTLLGIGLAFLVAESKILNRILMPYVVLSQVLPLVAIAPIIYITFGFNDTSRIILVILISFFPVVIGTSTGLLDVDKNLVYLMRTLGASETKIFYKIRLPNSLPHMFNGLRIGITGATVGAIVAEFVSSNAGLGYLITTSLTTYEIRTSFVAVFLLGILGLILYGAVTISGRFLMPWFRSH